MGSKTQHYSYAQQLWRLVLLSVVTFGVYEIYWFYRTWKHMRDYEKKNISPGWRTAALSVPVYNIVLIYRQFKDIRDSAQEAGCPAFSSPGLQTFIFVMVSLLLIVLSLYELKVSDTSMLFFLTLLIIAVNAATVLPLAVVQNTRNNFWKKQQPELNMRTSFSRGEITLLVLGGLYWLMTFGALFAPQ